MACTPTKWPTCMDEAVGSTPRYAASRWEEENEEEASLESRARSVQACRREGGRRDMEEEEEEVLKM